MFLLDWIVRRLWLLLSAVLLHRTSHRRGERAVAVSLALQLRSSGLLRGMHALAALSALLMVLP
jgi:hypothetical protein